MSLLGAVASRLEEAGISFALIGASAVAVHGVARATGDVDLLTVAPDALLRAADLALLKLYAAGEQELWDVQRLLDASPDRANLVAEVEAEVAVLGESATAAWRRARG